MKKAFTMAEAILVMVILGIIATIMISNMKPVEFRDKGLQVLAKKVLGQIDTATTQILFNNAQDSRMDKLYAAGSNTATYSFGANLTDTKVLYNTYLVGTRENATGAWCKDRTHMMLKDGSCIAFTAAASANTWIPGQKNPMTVTPTVGLIYVDVNDYEEPNILGKDQWLIPVGTYGIDY